MSDPTICPPHATPDEHSRRAFIRQLGRLAAGGLLTGRAVLAAEPDFPETPSPDPPASPGPADVDGKNAEGITSAPASRPADRANLSVVAELINPHLLAGARIHEVALRDAIERGLGIVLEDRGGPAGWPGLLRADDVIGIRFDPVGAERLGTNESFARALVASLTAAGFSAANIVLIDVPRSLSESLGTTAPRPGWQEQETAADEVREHLARVLEQITALINVPALKHDQVFGLSGAIKNASLPFIRRQLPYYRRGGAAGLARILAMPPIRSKLRIHIVNGLRGVFDGGPAVRSDCIWEAGRVLVSIDPVAVDHLSVEIIDRRRREAGLPPIGDRWGHLPHIREAARLGLGTDDQDYIRHVQIVES